ncbi:MAG: hypothetical protein JW909_07410 [Planctomycetes bacterium]|nr:hypothetical protein [Planctomycetota bacterium]
MKKSNVVILFLMVVLGAAIVALFNRTQEKNLAPLPQAPAEAGSPDAAPETPATEPAAAESPAAAPETERDTTAETARPLPADTTPREPVPWESIGLGGGGAMYAPVSSPKDRELMFVSCDMGGFYRSTDGGRSWRMVDFRQTHGSTACKPAFHPGHASVIYFKNLVSRDAGVTWEPVSPDAPFSPDSVVEIALDHRSGDLILVGTTDGLYVSSDAGKSWRKSEGVSGTVVGLYVDPLSFEGGSRVFCATGSGVFRSDDGGVSFQNKTGGIPGPEIRDLAGGRSDRSGLVLYCTVPGRNVNGGYQGGVYRSDDAAETWSPVPGQGLNRGLKKIDPYGDGDIAQYHLLGVSWNDPELVYVTCLGTGYWPPDHSTVYRSEDGGRSWSFVYNRDFRFDKYATVAEGRLNVDNGWIPYALTWIWGGFHTGNGFHVNPRFPDVLMWTDGGTLDISHDGGKSWTGAYTKYAEGQDKPAPAPAKDPGFWQSVGLEVTSTWNYAIDPFDHDHHFICYTDVGIAYSLDRGRTWYNNSRKSGAAWTNTTYALVFDPDRKDLVWAAMSSVHDIPHWTYTHDQAKGAGGVSVSDDGGITWKKSSTGLPSAPAASLVLDPTSPAGRRTLYVALYDHGVYKSTDNGATWQPSSNGIDLKRNSHSWLVKRHPDGTLFCGVTARRVGGRRSHDFPEPGALYRSADEGTSWEDITVSCPLHWPNGFAVHPSDSNIIYLSAGTIPRGREGGIYKTVDGGKSWTRLLRDEDFEGRGGPGYVQGMFVTMDPEDSETVYLGTDSQGLWVTHDAGTTWKQVEGLPFGNCHRVEFDPDNHDIVYVTTFGGGVWKGPRP